MSEAIAVVSFEEFCSLEARGDRRHELVGGRIYDMAGGSERQDLAAGLLYELIAPAARAIGCRPFTANRMVRTTAGAAYYPDVMVVCGPAAHRLYEKDPVLVLQVLSSSTEQIDRREKPLAFATSPALRHYLLVDPDRRRIEVAEPHSGSLVWQAYGPGDVVSTRFGVIDVSDFYDALDATASTSLDSA